MATPLDVIGLDDILVAIRPGDKRSLLATLAQHVAERAGCDLPALLSAVLRREELGSTGIGEGVAIPHARLREISRPSAVLALLARPIEFEAVDGRPVDLVVLLACSEGANGEALQTLSGLSRCLRRPEIRANLRRAKDAAAAYAVLRS